MLSRLIMSIFVLGLIFPACDDAPRPDKLSSEQCSREVLKLRGWIQQLTEETDESPVPVRPSIFLLVANIDKADRPTSSRPLVEIAKKRTWVENQVARPGRLQELLSKTAAQARNLGRGEQGETLPRLLLAIDRDAPWSRLVSVQAAAVQAGFTQLSILFTPYGKETTARPGPSDIDAELDAIGKLTDPVKKVPRLAKLTRQVCASCPQLGQVFRSLSATNPEAKARVIGRYLPEAVSQCGCGVDLPSLRAILWTMLERPSMIAALFEISTQPADKEKVVRLPPDTPWHKANVYIRSLVRPGVPRRVRFAVP